VLFYRFSEELFYPKYRGHSAKIFTEIPNNSNVSILSLQFKKVLTPVNSAHHCKRSKKSFENPL